MDIPFTGAALSASCGVFRWAKDLASGEVPVSPETPQSSSLRLQEFQIQKMVKCD
jgi:hypothetical protein